MANNNSRKYIIEKIETRQSGTTSVVITSIVTPTLIDAFSGTSFSYEAITTSALAAMSDTDYQNRVNSYLSILQDIDLTTIGTLVADSTFYDPSCTSSVYLSNVAVSCVYPPVPPAGGGTQYSIEYTFNSIESYYTIVNNSGVSTEDNKRVYDINLSPNAVGETITIGFNYEMAISNIGVDSDYIAAFKVYKNAAIIYDYSATVISNEIEGNGTFTITNTDTIKIILEASGYRNTVGDSNGGAISTIEFTSAVSDGNGDIINKFPISLQSAKVGIYI